jgi:hypothetical protein
MSDNPDIQRPALTSGLSFTSGVSAHVLVLVTFGLACIPVLLAPLLPTIDFYDHISRYFVLSHLKDSAFLRESFEANWSILPNIAMDVLAMLFMDKLDGFSGAKIVALIIFGVQYFGVIFFNRVLTGRINVLVAVLTAPLLYSFIFTWGFANFLLGLGLVFWGAGAWLALRNRFALAVAVGVVAGVAIFLTHGVAFALYGILLGCFELGFLFTGQTPLRIVVRNMAGLAAQAVIPTVLFLASSTVGAAGGVTNAAASAQQLSAQGRLFDRLNEIAWYRAQTIVRVAEGPSLAFDIVTFVLVGAAIAWLIRQGRLRVPRVAWCAIAVGLMLVALVPPAMFGVGYVSDRIPLFLAFLLVGTLSFQPGDGRTAAWLVPVGLLVALAVVRIGAITYDWRRYDRDLAAYDSVVSELPPHQVVGYLNVQPEHRGSGPRRCEMYGPLLVSAHGHASQLFAIPTAQPLKLRGKLLAGLEDLPPHRRFTRAEARAYYYSVIDAILAERRFDYLLLCDAASLEGPLPDTAYVVANSGRFTLIRLR